MVAHPESGGGDPSPNPSDKSTPPISNATTSAGAAGAVAPAPMGDTPARAPPSAPAPVDHEPEEEGGDMLLVTEFPPPPFYYTLASSSLPPSIRLRPPEIPHRAFRIAAKKVAAERRRAREESDRIRSAAVGSAGEEGGAVSGGSAAAGVVGLGDAPGTVSGTAGSGGGGIAASAASEARGGDASTSRGGALDDDDDLEGIDINDPNAPVVAVFGEIVEDPTLTMEEECDDPILVQKNVKELNRRVIRGFLNLVQKLVHDSNDNKKQRDELSHDIFLMLQECNKFREHQARELLISTLERQLEHRDRGLRDLREQIKESERALDALEEFRRAEEGDAQ